MAQKLNTDNGLQARWPRTSAPKSVNQKRRHCKKQTFVL